MTDISFRWHRPRTASVAVVAVASCLLAGVAPATASAASSPTAIVASLQGRLLDEPAGLGRLGVPQPGAASRAAVTSTTSSTPLATALKQRAAALVAAGASGVVGRVPDRHGVAQVAAGVEERTSGRRAQAGDTFEIGSITKTFMATLALQLVAERRLRLDDTIERWLPGLVPGGEHITVKMLLNHTSGLFNYTNDPALLTVLATDPAHVFSPQELVALATSHAPDFAPGTAWEYSNTNFVLVGMILQSVTGVAPRDLLRVRITNPLHLTRTWLADTAPVGDQPRYLHGYLLAPATADAAAEYVDVSGFSLSWASTAGAMISTTADLDRFFGALLGGRLLPPAQLRQMQTTVTVPNTDGSVGYGLGLLRTDTACGTLWGHDGITLGHLSDALFTADGRRGLVSDVSTRPLAWGSQPAAGSPEEQFLAADSALLLTEACAVFGKPPAQ